MLQMPLEESMMPKGGPAPMESVVKGAGVGNSGVGSSSNFLLANSQLTNYAQRNDLQPQAPSYIPSTFGPSPLDQLIKLHERFQQGEFSATSSTSIPPPASSLKTSTLAKIPPGGSNGIGGAQLLPTAFDHFGGGGTVGAAPFGAHSLLDPSSLMFSSCYTATAAANAAQQLAPMAAAAAAAAAPWTSPTWPWSAGETAAAALLNGSGSGASPGGWTAAGNYFAFGGLVSNQLGTAGAVQQQFGGAPSPSLLVDELAAAANSAKNGSGDGGRTAAQKEQQQQKGEEGGGGGGNLLTSSLAPAGGKSTTTTMGPRGQNGGGGGLPKMGRGAQRAAGGKMRSSAGHGSAGGKSCCECPNCVELQRMGAPLDKKREKHSCHIPGCHKVYNRSSHLKAHLRWHSTDRPTTTKRRLFDPPDGPLLVGSLLNGSGGSGSGGGKEGAGGGGAVVTAENR